MQPSSQIKSHRGSEFMNEMADIAAGKGQRQRRQKVNMYSTWTRPKHREAASPVVIRRVVVHHQSLTVVSSLFPTRYVSLCKLSLGSIENTLAWATEPKQVSFYLRKAGRGSERGRSHQDRVHPLCNSHRNLKVFAIVSFAFWVEMSSISAAGDFLS